jgi:hypothetical protein
MRRPRMQTLVCAALLALSPAFAAASKRPEPPRATVDTIYKEQRGGRVLTVSRDGDLQAALETARGGDVITLEPGAVYTGPFTLPAKRGAGWVVVRTAAPDGKLPPPGRRVDPSYAAAMPKLVAAPDLPVLKTAPGAHHYRFIGLEIRPAADAPASPAQMVRAVRHLVKGEQVTDALRYSNQTLVQLGAHRQSLAEVPHHLIFDRFYLSGGFRGARRGIALNSSHTAVIDSWLADFKTVGEDSQALAGWNGPGPFRIANNYLEGAGENLLFGGGDPSIPDLVPADIEIRNNHFSKPLSWRIGDPSYSGTPWTVKNLLELKNARRVEIDGNILEYSWHQAQDGYAVLFTVRNQDGGAPWSVVEDVLFSNNVVRHVGNGIHILGYDYNHPSRQTQRIHIRNNLFYDVGGDWARGQLFQLLDGTADIVIEHNTALHTHNIAQGGENRAHTGFIFANNIVMHNDYGIVGDSSGPGAPSLERYFPDARVQGNVMIGGSPEAYPRDNFFPRSLDELVFVEPGRGDYRLKKPGVFRAKDGGPAGVDFDALCGSLRDATSLVSSVAPCGGERNVAAAESRGGV